MPSIYRTRSKSTTTTPWKMKTQATAEVSPSLPADESSPIENVTKKRRRLVNAAEISVPKRKAPLVDLTSEVGLEDCSPPKKKRKLVSRKDEDQEKRLRVFRKHAPQSYLEKLHRATSQRMFVIDRTRSGTNDAPNGVIEMAGSTGNIYHVHINHLPSCTCPDNQKGNQCKHIVYVLHNVLKVPEHLQYQLAFISSELRTIFSHAPSPPSSQSSANPATSSSNRKPQTGDCPICFTEFSPSTEEILYCRAACGNNVHKECFAQWARTRSPGAKVTCVYCRSPWEYDREDEESVVRALKNKASDGREFGSEGYLNVGRELGLSAERDLSTYHPYRVRRQFGTYD